MENKNLKNGIYYATIGSLWWGLLGTYFFQYISYAGTVEVVVHRSLWTCIILFLTTIYFKKWPHFKKIFLNKKNLVYQGISELSHAINFPVDSGD